MANHSNLYWACPFFTVTQDTKLRILCEGGRIQTPAPEALDEYSQRYCAGGWEDCSLAQLMLRYYVRQEEREKAECAQKLREKRDRLYGGEKNDKPPLREQEKKQKATSEEETAEKQRPLRRRTISARKPHCGSRGRVK